MIANASYFLMSNCLYASKLIIFFLLIPGRGQEYWEQENISEDMPACRQMFNIFHPYDPVAYRFVIILALMKFLQ
jgi:hypothetical protein